MDLNEGWRSRFAGHNRQPALPRGAILMASLSLPSIPRWGKSAAWRPGARRPPASVGMGGHGRLCSSPRASRVSSGPPGTRCMRSPPLSGSVEHVASARRSCRRMICTRSLRARLYCAVDAETGAPTDAFFCTTGPESSDQGIQRPRGPPGSDRLLLWCRRAAVCVSCSCLLANT